MLLNIFFWKFKILKIANLRNIISFSGSRKNLFRSIPKLCGKATYIRRVSFHPYSTTENVYKGTSVNYVDSYKKFPEILV